MRLARSGHLIGLGAVAALVGLIPWVAPSEYYLTVLIVAAFHVILTVGLNLLMGYAGQVSLGHAAFYGLAAYTSGVLTVTYRWPVLLGMAAGVACAVLVAALIAVPTLRLRGHYLAMGTLGFGLIVYIVLNEATAVTGGPSGLTNIPRLSLFGHTVASDLEFYYVVWEWRCSCSFWPRTWCGPAWGGRCAPSTPARPRPASWGWTRRATRPASSS